MKPVKCPRCRKGNLVPVADSAEFFSCEAGCPGLYQKMMPQKQAG